MLHLTGGNEQKFIKVTVKFFATFREVIKEGTIEIELEEDTDVSQLLQVLCNSYDLRDQLFDEKNDRKKWIKILINGRNIDFLEGLKTRLNSDDVIAVFPPVAGGVTLRSNIF
ncbi:MAG: ubiquitin-like small modifier protein 1 [Candidatus Hermodarchaeota archaeon]